MIWKLAVFILAFAVTNQLLPGNDYHEDLLRGKKVLVTGASKGIGEQVAYEFARRGASVFITARNATQLQTVVENCKKLGSSSAYFGYMAMDMMHPNPQQLIDTTVYNLGKLDIIVLNHALLPRWQEFTSSPHSFEILEKSLQVNVLGTVQVMIRSLPHLVESKGMIGVVNSLAGKVPFPYGASYVASKFALDGFFGSFRKEIQHTGVTITNCVLGVIGTETLKDLLLQMSEDFKFSYSDVMNNPFGPARPDETGAAIVRGIALRENEIYFPGMVRYIVYMRDFLIRFNLIPGLPNNN